MMAAELPLRVDDAAGGAVIRCLCGAEAAVMRPGPLDSWRGTADPSAAGMLRMVLHAKRCLTGRNLMAAVPPPVITYALVRNDYRQETAPVTARKPADRHREP
jgi:hypothetical protein